MASQFYLVDFCFFFGPPALAGRVLWNRVCPSFCPSILPFFRLSFHLSGHFLGIVSLVFSKFWHNARNPYEVVCVRAGFSRKIFFTPQNCKNGPKMGQRRGILNILKNFVINFHWICSVTKIYIICYVPAQIPYLGKICFLRYAPKYSPSIRLQDFLINRISRKNQWNSLIFCMLMEIHIN